MTLDDLPNGWESGGPGEAIGKGPDRTFTHWFSKYDPESVEQPRDSSKRKILEMQVYHDSGQSKYYAIVEEATQRIEDGDVVETVSDSVVDREVVEVEDEDGYTSPSSHTVQSHEDAEELIFEKSEALMRKHY